MGQIPKKATALQSDPDPSAMLWQTMKLHWKSPGNDPIAIRRSWELSISTVHCFRQNKVSVKEEMPEIESKLHVVISELQNSDQPTLHLKLLPKQLCRQVQWHSSETSALRT